MGENRGSNLGLIGERQLLLKMTDGDEGVIWRVMKMNGRGLRICSFPGMEDILVLYTPAKISIVRVPALLAPHKTEPSSFLIVATLALSDLEVKLSPAGGMALPQPRMVRAVSRKSMRRNQAEAIYEMAGKQKRLRKANVSERNAASAHLGLTAGVGDEDVSAQLAAINLLEPLPSKVHVSRVSKAAQDELWGTLIKNMKMSEPQSVAATIGPVDGPHGEFMERGEAGERVNDDNVDDAAGADEDKDDDDEEDDDDDQPLIKMRRKKRGKVTPRSGKTRGRGGRDEEQENADEWSREEDNEAEGEDAEASEVRLRGRGGQRKKKGARMDGKSATSHALTFCVTAPSLTQFMETAPCALRLADCFPKRMLDEFRTGPGSTHMIYQVVTGPKLRRKNESTSSNLAAPIFVSTKDGDAYFVVIPFHLKDNLLPFAIPSDCILSCTRSLLELFTQSPSRGSDPSLPPFSFYRLHHKVHELAVEERGAGLIGTAAAEGEPRVPAPGHTAIAMASLPLFTAAGVACVAEEVLLAQGLGDQIYLYLADASPRTRVVVIVDMNLGGGGTFIAPRISALALAVLKMSPSPSHGSYKAVLFVGLSSGQLVQITLDLAGGDRMQAASPSSSADNAGRRGGGRGSLRKSLSSKSRQKQEGSELEKDDLPHTSASRCFPGPITAVTARWLAVPSDTLGGVRDLQLRHIAEESVGGVDEKEPFLVDAAAAARQGAIRSLCLLALVGSGTAALYEADCNGSNGDDGAVKAHLQGVVSCAEKGALSSAQAPSHQSMQIESIEASFCRVERGSRTYRLEALDSRGGYHDSFLVVKSPSGNVVRGLSQGAATSEWSPMEKALGSSAQSLQAFLELGENEDLALNALLGAVSGGALGASPGSQDGEAERLDVDSGAGDSRETGTDARLASRNMSSWLNMEGQKTPAKSSRKVRTLSATSLGSLLSLFTYQAENLTTAEVAFSALPGSPLVNFIRHILLSVSTDADGATTVSPRFQEGTDREEGAVDVQYPYTQTVRLTYIIQAKRARLAAAKARQQPPVELPALSDEAQAESEGRDVSRGGRAQHLLAKCWSAAVEGAIGTAWQASLGRVLCLVILPLLEVEMATCCRFTREEERETTYEETYEETYGKWIQAFFRRLLQLSVAGQSRPILQAVCTLRNFAKALESDGARATTARAHGSASALVVRRYRKSTTLAGSRGAAAPSEAERGGAGHGDAQMQAIIESFDTDFPIDAVVADFLAGLAAACVGREAQGVTADSDAFLAASVTASRGEGLYACLADLDELRHPEAKCMKMEIEGETKTADEVYRCEDCQESWAEPIPERHITAFVLANLRCTADATRCLFCGGPLAIV